MADRKYILTIVRDEPNPSYEPEQYKRFNGPHDMCSERISTREVSAAITEEEFDVIKQALLKVWK